MNFVVSVIIFVIIVILYLHLVQQYKKGEDLEIYEMDYLDNKQLQEICELKQPVLFKFNNIEKTFFNGIRPDTLNGSYELKIKDIDDYYHESKEHVGEHVKMTLFAFDKLMKSDVKSIYFTENNDEFIEDTGLNNTFSKLDTYLKPQYSIILQTKYDIMFGSKNAYTPLRYHLNYRNFIAVTSGKISIKMTPYKSYKFLHPNKNYDNYEFYSDINVWKPQPKYLHEMEKLKFLEFEVQSGCIVYIPSYWWYSIKYTEEHTILTSVVYNSAMNIISNTQDIVKYYIQQQNTNVKVISNKHNENVEETQSKTANDEKIVEIPLMEPPTKITDII
jgi:hypothetical protein